MGKITTDEISLELQNSINGKVDKVTGKVLSTNDYTNTDKNLVNTISSKANQSDLTTLTNTVNNKVDKVTGKQLSTNDYTNTDKVAVDTISNKANQSDLIALTNTVNGKVDKVTGKQLSTNDYTNTDKAEVAKIASKAEASVVTSLTNTVNGKVDKVTGKGLSTNDYTAADKTAVGTISSKASQTELNELRDIINNSTDSGAFNELKKKVDTNISNISTNTSSIFTLTNNKVDKVTGKGLSTNDYTAADKAEVAKIASKANQSDLTTLTNTVNNKVDKVTGKQLSTNDYTTADKTAVGTIGNKVDKVTGKELSTNDYTATDKAEVAKIASKADVSTVTNISNKLNSVESSWNGFKANGGTINGNVTAVEIAYKAAGTNKIWSNYTHNEGYTLLKSNTQPSGQWRDEFIMAYDGFAGYGDKSLGTSANPWKDLFIKGLMKTPNGYTKLPNGILLQWGILETMIYDNGTTISSTINYPVSFPVGTTYIGSSVETVLNTNGGYYKAAAFNVISVNRTQSGFEIYGNTYGNTAMEDKPIRCYWFAIGY